MNAFRNHTVSPHNPRSTCPCIFNVILSATDVNCRDKGVTREPLAYTDMHGKGRDKDDDVIHEKYGVYNSCTEIF